MKRKLCAYLTAYLLVMTVLMSIPAGADATTEDTDLDIEGNDNCGCEDFEADTIEYTSIEIDCPLEINRIISRSTTEGYTFDLSNITHHKDDMYDYYIISGINNEDMKFIGLKMDQTTVEEVSTVEVNQLSDGFLLTMNINNIEIIYAVGNEITSGTITVSLSNSQPITQDYLGCIGNCLWDGFASDPLTLLLCMAACLSAFIPPFVPGLIACIGCTGPQVGSYLAYCLITDPPWAIGQTATTDISLPVTNTQTGLTTMTNIAELEDGDVVNLNEASEDWYYQLQ